MTPITKLALTLISRPDLLIVSKATAVLAFGLAVLPFTRRSRASVQHLLMAVTFGAVLVLPLVVDTVPAVMIHVPVAASTEMSSARVTANSGVSANGLDIAHNELPALATLLRLAWVMGAIVVLLILAVDLRRLRLLRQHGIPWREQLKLVQSLARANGIHRSIDVLLHEGATTPLTYGILRPAIILPIDASDWSDAELRRALVHELEHVRRCDWVTQLLARFVCACYWFNPLVWTAWRQLCLAAERACDDSVLQSAECTEYADQLVNLARRISTTRAVPSLAMASRSDLSSRVMALLDARRRRGRAGYATSAAIIAASCATVLVIASVQAIAAPTIVQPKVRVVPRIEVGDHSALSSRRPMADVLKSDKPSRAPTMNNRPPKRRVGRTIEKPVSEVSSDSITGAVSALQVTDSSTKRHVKTELRGSGSASASVTASQSSSASSSANRHSP